MSRGLPSVLVTTPKLDDARVVFGAANCGWLKMLKNSVRNSRFIRSPGPKVVLLNTEKSKFLTPSCRRLGSTRGSFPKLNAGGAVKQAVLNHWFSLEPPLPAADLFHPATTFGLKVPIPNAESALDPPSEIFRGKPR